MIEKRQSARRLLHVCPREATVLCNGQLIGSAVLDESTGGVSVFVTDPRELHDGDLIEYVDATDGQTRPARVTYIRQDVFELHRIGLAWDESST